VLGALRAPAPTTLLVQTLFEKKLCKNAVLYICTKEPKSRIFWHPKTQKTPITSIDAKFRLHSYAPSILAKNEYTPRKRGTPLIYWLAVDTPKRG
jgi:hypothetical protein